MNKIRRLKWVNDQTDKFWIEIHNFKDAGGEYCFRKVSEGVIKILLVPISNSDVERVFSQVRLSKPYIRNRLSFNMMKAIISNKFHIKSNVKRLEDWIPSDSLCRSAKTHD